MSHSGASDSDVSPTANAVHPGEAPAAPPAPVLSFEHVTIESGASYPYDSSVWDVHLTLRPGDLVLVRMEKEHTRLPLADAACGITPAAEGVVRFLGESWSDLPAERAAARRGRIGRVFEDQGWVRNLSIE